MKESFNLKCECSHSDHSCGYCSLLPNLLKGFGWNPGKKLIKWFGEQLRERAGDADVTFREVIHFPVVLARLPKERARTEETNTKQRITKY